MKDTIEMDAARWSLDGAQKVLGDQQAELIRVKQQLEAAHRALDLERQISDSLQKQCNTVRRELDEAQKALSTRDQQAELIRVKQLLDGAYRALDNERKVSGRLFCQRNEAQRTVQVRDQQIRVAREEERRMRDVLQRQRDEVGDEIEVLRGKLASTVAERDAAMQAARTAQKQRDAEVEANEKAQEETAAVRIQWRYAESTRIELEAKCAKLERRAKVAEASLLLARDSRCWYCGRDQ